MSALRRKPRAPRPPRATGKTLSIRMYDVGFGDSFLIRLPEGQTVLVDAGFHSQGKGAFSGNELAEQVIADVTTNGRARVDVVIATHRHADHISSFNSESWKRLEVGEVWLPWVEDLSAPGVKTLWKKHFAFASGVARSLDGFRLDDDRREAIEFMLWNAGVDLAGPLGIWSNANAMDTLRKGFARPEATRRYLPEDDAFPSTFSTPVLPGARVHVLGPPKDAELIDELDPSKDDESYRAFLLRAAELGGEAPSTREPFDDRWRSAGQVPLTPRELRHLTDVVRNADPLFAAQKLDDAINSTSLVLVLEVGSARLLLPGDAEWGTWKHILASPKARALLERTTFFKVGHHGSHNATPKSLVEDVLPSAIPAMISTQEGEGQYRNDIPLPELLAALKAKKLEVARSDEPEDAPKRFKQGAKWLDLEVPC